MNEMGMALVISFVKGQRIQWLGNMMRRSEDDINRAILDWQPMRNKLSLLCSCVACIY